MGVGSRVLPALAHTLNLPRCGVGGGETWSQRVVKAILAHTRCGGCFRGGVAGAEPPHKGGPNRPDRPNATRENSVNASLSELWAPVGRD